VLRESANTYDVPVAPNKSTGECLTEASIEQIDRDTLPNEDGLIGVRKFAQVGKSSRVATAALQ